MFSTLLLFLSSLESFVLFQILFPHTHLRHCKHKLFFEQHVQPSRRVSLAIATFELVTRELSSQISTLFECDEQRSIHSSPLSFFAFFLNFFRSFLFVSVCDCLAGKLVTGACEIGRNAFAGRRWIHWEASTGMIILKEIWLDQNLIDHAICLQLGGSFFSCCYYCSPLIQLFQEILLEFLCQFIVKQLIQNVVKLKSDCHLQWVMVHFTTFNSNLLLIQIQFLLILLIVKLVTLLPHFSFHLSSPFTSPHH